METLEVTLSPELQTLVETRLDLVDRVLVDARLSRGERTSILQELEGQIVQLIERRSEHPTLDDVLAVLAELDPPEAFLAEEEPDAARDFGRARSSPVRIPAPAPASEPGPGCGAAAKSSAPSGLAVWAGSLVAGTALTTGLLMSAAVWFAPELVLGLVAAIQIAALVGAGLGVARLVQSPPEPVSSLERVVAGAAAGTAPLTVAFLLMMVSLWAGGTEIVSFVFAGFVGGAWVHGAWLGAATGVLWGRRSA